jgi:hypothetical protein
MWRKWLTSRSPRCPQPTVPCRDVGTRHRSTRCRPSHFRACLYRCRQRVRRTLRDLPGYKGLTLLPHQQLLRDKFAEKLRLAAGYHLTLAIRVSARLTGRLFWCFGPDAFPAFSVEELLAVNRPGPEHQGLRRILGSNRERAQEVIRHYARGGSVPQPKMARTERHHLSALRLAAIDRQAAFTAAVIKAGADRQAQWW